MNAWALPPRFRYHGTDIDGAQVDPPSLAVRGRDLNAMIGETSFAAAVHHVLTGELPSAVDAEEIDGLLTRCLARLHEEPRLLAVVSAAVEAGASSLAAAASGLMCLDATQNDGMDLPRALGSHACPGLLAIGITPALFAYATAVRERKTEALQPVSKGRSFVANFLRLAVPDGTTTAAGVAAFDALLVAWHAGFGYITPTVMVPRICCGTGTPPLHAIAAGFLAGGPKHTGAAEQAMRWFSEIRGACRGRRGTRDLVRDAVARQLASPDGLAYGYGHPLFTADPRPPRLRALFERLQIRGEYMDIFDTVSAELEAQKGLKPNIDAISAAAYLQLGIEGSEWGSAIGMIARVAAMFAHIVERQAKPALGVNSRQARLMLERVPVGWI